MECEHEAAGYRHLDYEQTIKHLNMHYQRALREIEDDKLIPDPRGLTAFCQSLMMGDALRRGASGQLPWDMVLHHSFHEAYKLGKKCQAMGMLHGAEPESDADV